MTRSDDAGADGDVGDDTLLSARRSPAASAGPQRSGPPPAAAIPEDATAISSRRIPAREEPAAQTRPGPRRGAGPSAGVEVDPVATTAISRGRAGRLPARADHAGADAVVRPVTLAPASRAGNASTSEPTWSRSEQSRPSGHAGAPLVAEPAVPVDRRRAAVVPDAAVSTARHAARPPAAVVVPRGHVPPPPSTHPLSAAGATVREQRRDARARRTFVLTLAITAGVLVAAVVALVLLLAWAP